MAINILPPSAQADSGSHAHCLALAIEAIGFAKALAIEFAETV